MNRSLICRTVDFTFIVKIIKRVNVCLLLYFLCNSPIAAQTIDQISPQRYSIRGICLGSLWTAIAVGDSNHVLITHRAFDPYINYLTITWTELNTGFSSSTTWDAVAFAGDTLHAVIGGWNGALARTTDGGNTWTAISLGTTASIRAITWNKDGVLIGVCDSGIIIRSTDQGQTWKKVPSSTTAPLNAVSFGTPSNGVAVGNDTTLVQTNDSGNTWQPMAFPYNFHSFWNHAEYDTIIDRIDFTGVAMVGADSVFVLMNGPIDPLLIYRGAIDTEAAPGIQHWPSSNTAIPTAATSLVYVGIPNYISVYETTLNDYYQFSPAKDSDARTWKASTLAEFGDADGTVDNFPFRLYCSTCWMEPDHSKMVMMMGGVNQQLEQYIWTSTQPSFLPPFLLMVGLTSPGNDIGTADILSTSFTPSGVGYVVSTYGILGTTPDGGKNWRQIAVPIYIAETGSDSSFDGVFTLDSSTAIATGWNGMIYKVDSAGASSSFIPSGTKEHLRGITFPSHDTGIITGDYGTILRSTNRGASWTSVPIATTSFLYSVTFANADTGIITGASGMILKTTNAGITWDSVNNILTGSGIDIRQVEGFSDGVFYARAGSSLLRSSDFGDIWQFVNIPVGDTLGISFYNSQIGIIGECMSLTMNDHEKPATYVADTAHLAYTLDGGTSWKEFLVFHPSNNRLQFHWLNDHQVLIFGGDYLDKVDITPSGVRVIPLTSHEDVSVYPNPITGDFHIDYTTKSNGPVTIQLFSEDGKEMGTLFKGTESIGMQEHELTPPSGLHGSYYLRVTKDGTSEAVPVRIK